jgi:4-amino-4-deoxy-L-arabinose transferase-like glycosyltransferase
MPVVAIAAAVLIAHLLTAGNYGIFRDEYYYLACSHRLDWGYVDHPPLSIWILAAVRAVLGDGILALRIVPAMCGSVLVVLASRIAARLGGGSFAQSLAALSMAIVGVVQVISGFYSMNAIDLVVWSGAWLILATWVAEPTTRRMAALGALLGLGLLNKIGVLVFGAALALALVSTPLRRKLASAGPWLGGTIALALFAPHVLWQQLNGWPTLEFIENAQRYKISAMPPLAFLGEIVLEQQPANLLLWAVGLGWLLFAARARPFRMLGWIVAIGMALLMLQRAKPYYAAGFFPVLLAAGACAWELWTEHGRSRMLRPALVALLSAVGLLLMPFTLPVLPVHAYARWQAWTGIAPTPQEVGHTSALPQHYSDRFGWEELAREVARIAALLTPEERARVVIIARNYGEAGALEYWRERYDLPRVVSGHNSYFFWAPDELSLETVIVVGWNREEVAESFGHVERAGTLEHAWALEDGLPLWIARRPLLTWPELRRNLRMFI